MATQPTIKKTKHENVVPFRPMSMFEEMERLFENFSTHNWLRPLREHGVFTEGLPQVDVIDQDETILVKAALPGIERDDLEVSTTPQTVTIRATTRKEEKQENDEYFRREISSGNYLRTVTLPASIDETNIKAKFRNGMLEITLPKLESARRHSINIETD